MLTLMFIVGCLLATAPGGSSRWLDLIWKIQVVEVREVEEWYLDVKEQAGNFDDAFHPARAGHALSFLAGSVTALLV